jgi:hypothetical protein
MLVIIAKEIINSYTMIDTSLDTGIANLVVWSAQPIPYLIYIIIFERYLKMNNDRL